MHGRGIIFILYKMGENRGVGDVKKEVVLCCVEMLLYWL